MPKLVITLDKVIVPERLRLSSDKPTQAEVMKAVNDTLREISNAQKKVVSAVQEIQAYIENL